jgi:hypothetical protein
MQHHLDVWEQCLKLGKERGDGLNSPPTHS